MRRKDLFCLNSERETLFEQKLATIKKIENLNLKERHAYIQSEIEALENLMDLDIAVDDYKQLKFDKKYLRYLFLIQLEG